MAAALIRPLAWELPYAAGATLKKKKKKKKKKKQERLLVMVETGKEHREAEQACSIPLNKSQGLGGEPAI